MSGTNPVATFGQNDFTAQTPTAYKTQIDANSIVMKRVVDCFAPRQSNTPAMTVTLDPGFIFRGNTLTELAAQTTGTIAAPLGNPRIDRVVVDKLTGVASVVTGSPAASPSAPAIPSGKVPICQVLLQTASTSITNSMITDERALNALGRGAAGEEGIGVWMTDDGFGNLTIDVNPTLRDNGAGKLTTGLTTEAAITAAATTNLGTLSSNIGVINGNTTITSFGNSASTANPFYILRVAGTPQLTNSANLILPGGANYQCAAGDMLFCKFEGSSKWRISILPASGLPVAGGGILRKQINASTGSFTFTTPATITSNTVFKITLTGGGGGGAGHIHGSGGGAGATIVFWASGLAPSTAYSGSVGAGGAGSTSNGSGGGNTSITIGATTYTAGGGAGGVTNGDGGAGGSGTNGELTIPGQRGGRGMTSTSINLGGHGGASFWGGGGSDNANGANGYDGAAYGSGGSGGAGSGSTGGSGANGVALIEWQ